MFVINNIHKNYFKNITNFIHKKMKHKQKNKNPSTKVALDYFDEFYKKIFGPKWPSIRLGLLSPHKYFAVINNFGDTEEVIKELESQGALNLKTLLEIERQNIKEKRLNHINRDRDKIFKLDKNKELFLFSKHPHNLETLTKTDDTEFNQIEKELSEPNSTFIDNFHDDSSKNTTNWNKNDCDEHRYIDPCVGLSASALYEFIPTTKLKGLEEWIPDSKSFELDESVNFPVKIEPEWHLNFPKHLKVYTYERGNITQFPSPKKSSTGVLNYYLLDGSSILPVLALGIQPGDNVLDMCAAPGGKSHAILQTLYPNCLVANDIAHVRVNRIKSVIDQYFLHMKENLNNIIVTQTDGRKINEENFYNKILVDVPCTIDRKSVNEDDNNIFRGDRIKERLKLPELQVQLLCNALKIVQVGGTVVYSTCSLSPLQNDGVVHMALKYIWEETNHEVTIKDLSRALEPAQNIFKFGENVGLRYGHLVLPFVPANFGPLYFCKIVKTR